MSTLPRVTIQSLYDSTAELKQAEMLLRKQIEAEKEKEVIDTKIESETQKLLSNKLLTLEMEKMEALLRKKADQTKLLLQRRRKEYVDLSRSISEINESMIMIQSKEMLRRKALDQTSLSLMSTQHKHTAQIAKKIKRAKRDVIIQRQETAARATLTSLTLRCALVAQSQLDMKREVETSVWDRIDGLQRQNNVCDSMIQTVREAKKAGVLPSVLIGKKSIHVPSSQELIQKEPEITENEKKILIDKSLKALSSFLSPNVPLSSSVVPMLTRTLSTALSPSILALLPSLFPSISSPRKLVGYIRDGRVRIIDGRITIEGLSPQAHGTQETCMEEHIRQQNAGTGNRTFPTTSNGDENGLDDQFEREGEEGWLAASSHIEEEIKRGVEDESGHGSVGDEEMECSSSDEFAEELGYDDTASHHISSASFPIVLNKDAFFTLDLILGNKNEKEPYPRGPSFSLIDLGTGQAERYSRQQEEQYGPAYDFETFIQRVIDADANMRVPVSFSPLAQHVSSNVASSLDKVELNSSLRDVLLSKERKRRQMMEDRFTSKKTSYADNQRKKIRKKIRDIIKNMIKNMMESGERDSDRVGKVAYEMVRAVLESEGISDIISLVDVDRQISPLADAISSVLTNPTAFSFSSVMDTSSSSSFAAGQSPAPYDETQLMSLFDTLAQRRMNLSVTPSEDACNAAAEALCLFLPQNVLALLGAGVHGACAFPDPGDDVWMGLEAARKREKRKKRHNGSGMRSKAEMTIDSVSSLMNSNFFDYGIMDRSDIVSVWRKYHPLPDLSDASDLTAKDVAKTSSVEGGEVESSTREGVDLIEQQRLLKQRILGDARKKEFERLEKEFVELSYSKTLPMSRVCLLTPDEWRVLVDGVAKDVLNAELAACRSRLAAIGWKEVRRQ
ncbi:hypothetical protein ADUPG1_008827, partial [Aduncisulcus paluster]